MDLGSNLPIFLSATLELSAREQAEVVNRIASAMAEVGPKVRETMEEHPGF